MWSLCYRLSCNTAFVQFIKLVCHLTVSDNTWQTVLLFCFLFATVGLTERSRSLFYTLDIMCGNCDWYNSAVEFLAAISIFIINFILNYVSKLYFSDFSVIPSLKQYLLYIMILTREVTMSQANSRYICLFLINYYFPFLVAMPLRHHSCYSNKSMNYVGRSSCKVS
jgi:ABC-type Na+ efflux pump permease subunit